MPDFTSRLLLPSPTLTGETPNVPRDVASLAVAAESAIGRLGISAPLQSGVVTGPRASLPVSPTGLSVVVNSGTAVIEGSDDLLYPLTVDMGAGGTEFVCDAAHATLPRIDQVILSLVPASGQRIHISKGTATTGATLDNRTGAVSDGALNVSYPDGWIRLMDIRIPAAATLLSEPDLRDRRPWARGFLYRNPNVIVGPIAAATFLTSGTVRAELRTGSTFHIEYNATATVVTPGATITIGLWLNGALVSTRAVAVPSTDPVQVYTSWTRIGVVGSNLLQLKAQSSSGNITLAAGAWSVVEDVGGPYGNNGDS